MPTSAQDKLDLAAKMVRQAKADGVPLREVTQQYEDADLAEAMEYTEDRARHERSLARRADAAERAKRQIPREEMEQERLGLEVEPVTKRLTQGFKDMGVEWNEGLKLIELARTGQVRLSPQMQADAETWGRLWDQNVASSNREYRMKRDEPDRAAELRGASLASMADPTFGGLPTE